MGRRLVKEQVLYFSNRVRRRKRIVFVWIRAINTNDVHVVGTGEVKRKKKSFKSLRYLTATAVERLKRKMTLTATPPPRLPLCEGDLMEKPGKC